MRPLSIPAVMILLVSPPATLAGQTRDENWKRCGSYDRTTAIEGCTALIQSGQETKENLAKAFYKRGKAYFEKEEYDPAIKDFDAALQLNPNDVDALFDRGNAYTAKGDFDRAIQDYDQAVRLDPAWTQRVNNKKAYIFTSRGNSATVREDYDQAIQSYSQALRIDPTSLLVLSFRAKAYFKNKDYDHAIQDYDEEVRLRPGAFTFYQRGVAQFCAGRFAAAEADFAKALEMEPKADISTEYALWLYVASSRSGKNATSPLKASSQQLDLKRWPGPVVRFYLKDAGAKDVLNAAGKSGTDSASSQAHFFLAEHALLRGQRPEAVDLFRKVIAAGYKSESEYPAAEAELERLGNPVRPESADWRRCKGLLEVIEGCTAIIQSGTESSERLADALYRRGSIYVNREKYDLAAADFDQALRLDPKNAKVFFSRGTLRLLKNDYDRAIQDYDQAVQLDPKLQDAFYNRGLSYLYKKQYGRAVQEFDHAVRLSDKNNKQIVWQRSIALFCAGRFAEAEKGLAQQQESQMTFNGVLWLYLARSRSGQDATAWLKTAAEQLDKVGARTFGPALRMWPGPVIRFYVGELTASDVLVAAKDSDAFHSEAYFFLAEHALLRGERAQAVEFFHKVIAIHREQFDEHVAAQAELDRLEPAQATTQKEPRP